MLKMYVMTHKEIDKTKYPLDRDFMLLGNKNQAEGYITDNTGDNISKLNPYFSELTGLYYIWKNDNDSEYVGLEHYRRLFSKRSINIFNYRIISKDSIEKYLDNYDIVLPKKHCWPKHNTLTEQYEEEHIASDIKILEELIKAKYTIYYDSYRYVMHNHNWAYNYNMFVCRKELIDEYCEFLFPILFELKEKINLNDGRSDYQKRVFGFLAERLFNVWIVYKNNLKIKELDLATLGDEPIYDLKRKIYRFFKWHKYKKYRNN